jgi:oligoribonuclease (3'-5' exoribonuclease)
MSEALPEEVATSMSDPVQQIEMVASTAKFHIKYYKQTLKKMLTRLGQMAKENSQLKAYVRSSVSMERNIHLSSVDFIERLIRPARGQITRTKGINRIPNKEQ